ncbi:MAG: toll/interleukin-1 receptor domain-containing protein [candidate division Zixibacteria bacterium]|nr:toll/interleukin-1 receptor domain-containing protein [candidate division Zixibacteria bacterium]
MNQCLLLFKDDVPVKFLRGCGLRDEEINYFQSQIGQAIRHYTCFICYSTKDEDFATRLHNDFQANGIRCWKWNEDARTGRKLIGEIDEAIRRFDKLVVIASKSSLTSPYVLEEIERAIQKERDHEARKLKGEYGGEIDVLFPVKLDNYIHDKWEHDRKADVTAKMIADARGWKKDHAKYEKVLKKLIADLRK